MEDRAERLSLNVDNYQSTISNVPEERKPGKTLLINTASFNKSLIRFFKHGSSPYLRGTDPTLYNI